MCFFIYNFSSILGVIFLSGILNFTTGLLIGVITTLWFVIIFEIVTGR